MSLDNDQNFYSGLKLFTETNTFSGKMFWY